MDHTTLLILIPVFIYVTQIPSNGAIKKCKEANTSRVTIELTCSSNQWIHVISEASGNETTEKGCLDTTNSCIITLKSSDQGMIVNCNGRQRCFEGLVGSKSDCSPVQGYEIEYDCVEESIDVCSTEDKSTNSPVFIHSTGFPEGSRGNDSCNCRITGTQMTILLIEHQYKGTDLNITTDGEYRPQSFSSYNEYIVFRASTATLSWSELDGPFWIKVEGSMIVNVSCSNQTNGMFASSISTSTGTTTVFTTSIQTSTNTTTTSSATISEQAKLHSSPMTTRTETTNDGPTRHQDCTKSVVIVGCVCGAIIFLLLISNSYLLYDKFLRQRNARGTFESARNEIRDNDNTDAMYVHYEHVTNSTVDTAVHDGDQQGTHSNSNTYNNLSQYENLKDVREYKRIHVYGNTDSDVRST